MRSIVVWRCSRLGMGALLLGMAIGGTIQVGHAQMTPPETSWNYPLSSGQIHIGLHFDDQQSETFGDMLVPLLQFKSGLMYVNPRGSWNDDDGQEFNLGLGYRHIFQKKNMIVGGNLFYDRRNTGLDHIFNQGGCGVELLSKWVDVRVNYYLPESGEKVSDDYVVAKGTSHEYLEHWDAPTGQGHVISQYGYEITDTYNLSTLEHFRMVERAMEGFDAEIGSLLPIPVVKDYAAVKAFVGYYDYNSHYENDIAGAKGRLEIKPLPAVCLDAAWYEDERLFGSRYSVGIRASFPFDLANLSRGRNPFADALAGFKWGPTKAPFSARLNEMVIRDLHIRIEATKPEEVVEDRRLLERTLVNHNRTDHTEILATDVTFVDGDNRNGMESGTWENPYRQINTGIQNAIGSLVYVRNSAQAYRENVVLNNGQTLWGSGAPIYGRGNSCLGGIYPVVSGGGNGPAITLANNVTVTGFEITQPLASLVSYPGIVGENVTNVRIVNNSIHGSGSTGQGIALRAFRLPVFSASIWDNRITDVRGAGIDIALVAVQDVTLTLRQNTVTANDEDGLRIVAIGDGGSFMASVSGNYDENGGAGVFIDASGFLKTTALFDRVHAFGNKGNGIAVDLVTVGDAVVSFSDVMVGGSGGAGVSLATDAFSGSVFIKAHGLTSIGNADAGVVADSYGYIGVNALFENIDAEHNQAAGISVTLFSGGSVNAELINNTLLANGSDGMLIDLNSGHDSTISGRGNVVANNGTIGCEFISLAPATGVYDFGMAGRENANYGLNAFYGNGSYQLLFDGPGGVFASGNWWGTPTPVGNVDYRSEGGGIITITPALPVLPTTLQ
ncbi:MAG: inverse autotransporter beta domain-containing protein [bacterium]